MKVSLDSDYPHLTGYFDDVSVGLVDKARIVEDAQSSFFKDQKEILEATNLNDEQYGKSLEYSSRILAEYILYRKKIINKLKQMSKSDDESAIHDLIAPRRHKFAKPSTFNDNFTNNAWVLDDKYMSYSKVLSDTELESVYGEIGVNGSHAYDEKDSGRPDITIVFSNDLDTAKKVDVVIVEFKKLGLKLADKEEVVSQLKQRARRLLEFYPEQIERIWFYGIIDFDNELRASLTEQGFTRLFSAGELYYKN